MLLTLLSIIICVFAFWLFFKFFKIVLRFLFCVIIATLGRYLVSNYTPYVIDDKWIVIAAVVLFIVSIIKSDATDGLFSFGEDFTESSLGEFLIDLFKILLRFIVYMVIATLALRFVLKHTSYTIDNKYRVLATIVIFILSIIRSNAVDGPFTFWEDFIESRFVQSIIVLLKILLRFVIYMVIANLAIHFIIKYTSFEMDSTSYTLVAIAMFILSIITSGIRKKSDTTNYIYIERDEPKDYILNSNSGIIHSRWDSSADEISEEHQIPLSSSDAIKLVRNDRSFRFKKDN